MRRVLKWVGILLISLTLLSMMTGCGKDGKTLIKEVYDEYATDFPEYISISEDGTCLKIDSNPTDTEGFLDTNVIEMLINATYKLLDQDKSAAEGMLETKAIDGVVTKETSSIKLEYTYHPSKGIEATFTAK